MSTFGSLMKYGQFMFFVVMALCTVLWLILYYVYPELSFLMLCLVTALCAGFAAQNFRYVAKMHDVVERMDDIDEKFETTLEELQCARKHNAHAVKQLETQNYGLMEERKQLHAKLEQLEKVQEVIDMFGECTAETLEEIKSQKRALDNQWFGQMVRSERFVILAAFKACVKKYASERRPKAVSLQEFKTMFTVLPKLYRSTWELMGGESRFQKAAAMDGDRLLNVKELGKAIMHDWVKAIVDYKTQHGFDF